MDIPRAPALGLFLDNVYYKWYNRTYGNDGIHEKLDWTEYEVMKFLIGNNYFCKFFAKFFNFYQIFLYGLTSFSPLFNRIQ